MNLIIYRVLSAISDYIFYAFLIRLRGIYLLLKMDKFKTFEAFYRRATCLKALFWGCLIFVIIFNFVYVALELTLIIEKKTTTELIGISERSTQIIFIVFELSVFCFHILMLVFFLSTIFVFANLVKG